ncbi:MAG: PQQ-dependent sugar dehydrogenase [Asticcacaulis sp.]|nr:PQQ-dependent sugar dehydrogenase [Asticcacaulis sp.]
MVGRTVGGAKGFAYSDSFKAAAAKGEKWDEKKLDAYLADPQKVMPGSAMPVNVADANDRKVLIAYLSSLKGDAATPAAAKTSAAAGSSDWRQDAPGVRHRVTVADLPAPYATPSASNGPGVVNADKAAPKVPAGFTVSVFASGLKGPRQIRVASTGDLFVAEAGANRVIVFHNSGGRLNPQPENFVSEIRDPFGIAFFPAEKPQYVYLSSPTSIIRAPFNGGAKETVVADLAPGGGHSSRDLIFSPDGKYLYAAVGSAGNAGENLGDMPSGWAGAHALGEAWSSESGRAMVLRFDPNGGNRHILATGIRNCVGLGIGPDGSVFCTVNERDGLGDDLVPDYFSRIQDGGYYGWPWYYLGSHADPRQKDRRPDLTDKATVPDLLFGSHSAPLGFTFYHAPAGAKNAFPAEYDGNAFVALHGSWNRARRTGSKVVRIVLKDGKPTGEYEDFMTGLVIDDSRVSGRPVGVAVGPDGALYVSDDAGGKIWKIENIK